MNLKKSIFIFILLLKSFGFACAEVHEANFENGSMKLNIEWSTNQTGGDALYSLISFKPNAQTNSCKRLSFIQTARVQLEGGIDYVWQKAEGQENRNHIKTSEASGVIPGVFIDHDALRCSDKGTCSPFYRDSWENNDESSDGESTATSKLTATMLDAPFGWEIFESITLEACAVCQNNNELNVLACVNWGGTWPATADRSIQTVRFTQVPSHSFKSALDNFIQFYHSNLYQN